VAILLPTGAQIGFIELRSKLTRRSGAFRYWRREQPLNNDFKSGRDEELRATGIAATVLDSLELECSNTARRISDIRNDKNPRARDLDI